MEKVGTFYIIVKRQRLLLDLRSYKTVHDCEWLYRFLQTIVICMLGNSDINRRILKHFSAITTTSVQAQ